MQLGQHRSQLRDPRCIRRRHRLRARQQGAQLSETSAVLSWPGAATPGSGRLELPRGLAWSLHRGETDPILGWYSGSFGRRVPAITLLGRGRPVADEPLSTRLEFIEAEPTMNRSFTSSAVSWSVSGAMPGTAGNHSEAE